MSRASGVILFIMETEVKNHRVARYFDDVFEAYVTELLTEAEAKAKAQELNRAPRHYVYFQARKIAQPNE